MSTATTEIRETNPTVAKLDIKAFSAFIKEFKDESDRAAVILGAAKLDIMLYQLLQISLRPSTSRTDELLDGDSPLATFSARIGLCHRLGLIDDEFCRVLHLIRKIRNSFAHELGGISLDSGAHRDRIQELAAPLRRSDGYNRLLKNQFGDNPGSGSLFRSVVALAAIRLEGACINALPIENNPYPLLVKNPKPATKATPLSQNEDKDSDSIEN